MPLLEFRVRLYDAMNIAFVHLGRAGGCKQLIARIQNASRQNLRGVDRSGWNLTV